MPHCSSTIYDVVRDVVADTAPEELPVVQGLGELREAAVSRRLRRAAPRREPLGFGIGEIAVLIAPVVWVVVEHAAKGATDSLLDRAGKWIGSLFRRSRTPVPGFTKEQLAEIYQAFLDEARRRKVPDESAIAAADALVRRLAEAPPDELDR
ncbi:hypothetical protein [Salininema proteolyticum]|uniref:Uncharacterized protein n=1 Tax=Salininema proteolyticum TaxID=1607685 RepID=A0ABV8TUD4_9ACTN